MIYFILPIKMSLIEGFYIFKKKKNSVIQK